MTVAFAIALLVSIVAHYAYQMVQGRAFAAEREKWALERRELLNRIQAPDRIPVADRAEFVVPDREPDEWAKVGQIELDPEYGLDDD